MDSVYNESYYTNYDVGIGKVNYADAEDIKQLMEAVADRIVSDLHPKTVLDAGCAMGYLVAALRDRGVEAYGVDISEYAISKVREDIRPYCAVGSLTEPLPEGLPRRYDLVVTIEVLEHLYAEDGRKTISNLCTYADKIIFSSTPDDYAEVTHVNVQQREYWARLFAENSFMDDLLYRPTYLTSYAVLYRRKADWLRQVEDYERFIAYVEQAQQNSIQQYNKELEDKERHIQNQTAMLDAAQSRKRQLEAQLAEQAQQLDALGEALETDRQELAHYKEHYFAAIDQCEELKHCLAQREEQIAVLQWQYDDLTHAFFWKITKPARKMVDGLKHLLRNCRSVVLLWKGLKCLKQHGVRYTWEKLRRKFAHRQEYAELAKRPLFTEKELNEQRTHTFPQNVKFSIVVPLFNTPENFLHEMLQSVIEQTYGNWELCLADGSDETHGNVKDVCQEYVQKDARIRYRKLEKNLGISGNTNACIDMATGEYIALFDHDDLLHPAALYEVMRAICEKGADFIYTDENTFHDTPADAFCPHFKPDFSPDTLRSYNYICHFTVFKKSLMDKTGMFRGAFDGSQDYDMVLRLTEQAEQIVHIPKILYYWRAHKDSVAQDLGAKPYTLVAARRTLSEHLARVGLAGTVEDSSIPSTYKMRYEIIDAPLVSIVIPNMDHAETLRTCIDSIFQKTTYPNYELVVVENNSKQEETFAYYAELKKDARVKLVTWADKFNYSAINNYGVREAAGGDYVLLLNNDIEVITPDWIQEMLMFAQRKDVGAVGAMLYYPDNTIQHAGVILGIGGVAGHSHKCFQRGTYGYMSRVTIAQNLSAVTAACMMIRRDVWEEVHGLDEQYEVAFNDVDLCMRIRQAGYLIVWTPYAELYHYESKSRGYEDTPEKRKRFEEEAQRFRTRWAKELAAGDPYYNPNFTLRREDFSLKDWDE